MDLASGNHRFTRPRRRGPEAVAIPLQQVLDTSPGANSSTPTRRWALPGWCCVPEGRPGPELLYLVRREGLLAVAARSKSLTGTGPTPMRGQTRILVTSVRRGRDTAGIPV